MQAWQIHSYNGLEDLRLSNVRMPVIMQPTDVLVKVEAASVNPIDVAMTNGYGTTLLNLMRKAKNFTGGTYNELDLPLTLGRDFAGVIVSKGHDVGDRLELGEEVWGVVPMEQQGCHANYVVVNNNLVISTCSSDAVDLLQSLGADIVIDYKQDDADSKIISEGPRYDIILDCANRGPEHVRMKGYPHSTYIALNSPLLKNTDQHGLVVGMAKNVQDFLKFNIPTVENKSCVKWGFFIPSQTGINVLQKLVENKEIVPVVQQVYPFQDLPLAYEKMRQGHLRGKLVIDIR
ncbi:reticulon-4-interacting protein mitochondrial-like protein [Lasius niger]|uniref:Reticulon-4-interacting protein mitochondrial-like protein n=1 Tax=Lasius niger TaxID=67767 RepID=A0A0J7L1H0_LASNI|nr:reticulon-4-interacting protein mitochondrial-like protein [Lasius niger]KMQ96514.1 reticulon-4-interacting protein mitochondrial-like protein [Lasius niger]